MIVFLLFSGVKFTEFIWVLLFFLPLEVFAHLLSSLS